MEDKKNTVLVVDDEKDFVKLISYWLESKGYLVISTHDGKSAIGLVKTKKPDIVFMDLRMPVMDGVEALKEIRSFDEKIPVIIISAYVDDPKIKEAHHYGTSGVFYKGKDFEEGLSLLEVALRTHRQLKK